ncbi:MAG: DUF4160 domain-containing protein [Ignavibacteriales bacterium]|nr:DUF4160 domain-containing protein [Ignavibacteriales bacterium]
MNNKILSILFPNSSTLNSIEDFESNLKQLLSSGISICPDGSLCLTRKLVDKINNLKIVIHPNDHNPPHFHVIYNNLNASFDINTCELLKGNLSNNDMKLIKYWFNNYKDKLLKVWNETRPSF